MGEPVVTAIRAQANEQDVVEALEGLYVGLGLSKPIDLLDFFKRMLEVVSSRIEKDTGSGEM